MGSGKSFFSTEEMDAIRRAVAAAEGVTSGQIATMIVDQSDSYREALFLGTVFLSGFFALFISIATHLVTIWSYIPLALLLALPCYLIFHRFPRLKLFFVGRNRLNEAVRERALRAFYEKGLYRTNNETGVLIFISSLEHKVWILGDRGINEKIDPDAWRHLAAQLADGIRQGRACDSLCAVIHSCGEMLRHYFPQEAGPEVNELPDEIIM